MMSPTPIKNHLTPAVAIAALIITTLAWSLSPTIAQAAPLPEQLVLAGSIGSELSSPHGVAVDEDPASPEYGDVYIADLSNHRIQVFTPGGEFVLMFGHDVNEKTKGDLCTRKEELTEAVKCTPGTEGVEPGVFSEAFSITVDPNIGDVYVSEVALGEEEFGLRVQKFTAEGQFVLEIGREVNETTKGNLCTYEEETRGEAKCGAPKAPVLGSTQAGAFDFEQGPGLLAVGGKEDLLYVGDEHRVQEFDPTGHPAGEISLTSISEEPRSRVQALALDQATGNLYLVYPSRLSDVVYEFGAQGSEVSSFPVRWQEAEQQLGSHVVAIGVDGEGRLAVLGRGGEEREYGTLLNGTTGQLISEFPVPAEDRDVAALAFGNQGDLFAVEQHTGEVLHYEARTIAALELGGYECVPGSNGGSSTVFGCTLKGEVNPEGISETSVRFEYAQAGVFDESTASQGVTAPGSVQATVSLPPNATYQYRLAGSDHNISAPEKFTSEAALLRTPTVAPAILGAPTAPFIRESAATLHAELNPENASSEYLIEYTQNPEALTQCTKGVRSEPCPGVGSTAVQRSTVYGNAGATVELAGLQPGTSYYERLFAENANSAKPSEKHQTIGPIGSFTTLTPPFPAVETGGYDGVSATAATLSGTVSPNGAPTAYAFELGVYSGAGTQYSIVYTGDAGNGTTPLPETLALTGLEPATTYSYRLAVTSGYIDNETHSLQGAPVTFTTAGVPSVLSAPTSELQLPVPAIAFPREAKARPPASSRRKPRSALKACRKDRSKRKLHACERAVRKRDKVKRKSTG